VSLPCAFSQNWLWYILQPDIRVAFLDTKLLNAPEIRGAILSDFKAKNMPDTNFNVKNDHFLNPTEAQIIFSIVDSIIRGGVHPRDIGIGCLYRGQRQHIQQLLGMYYPNTNVEVDTIDRFQGRDKQCILISCVRNNTEGEVGNLLKDWKRMNVAFTRAKSKLIVIGNSPTLIHSDCMKSVLDLMRAYVWYYELPVDSLQRVLMQNQ
jgi:DNA replication ATP-dependent helicase Dna2